MINTFSSEILVAKKKKNVAHRSQANTMRSNDLPINFLTNVTSAHTVIYYIQIIIRVSSYMELLGRK